MKLLAAASVVLNVWLELWLGSPCTKEVATKSVGDSVCVESWLGKPWMNEAAVRSVGERVWFVGVATSATGVGLLELGTTVATLWEVVTVVTAWTAFR